MAGSPGGHEVARLSVKVVPDTSNFAKDLKAYLQREEKSTSLKVNVELDTKAAEAKLKELSKKLSVTLKVNIDAAGISAKLDALAKNKSVSIKTNLDDLTAKVELDLLARDRHVNIKADVDKTASSRIGGFFSKIGSLASSVGSTVGSALSGGFNQATGAIGGTFSSLSSLGTKFQSIGQVFTVVIYAVIIPAIVGLVIAIAGIAGALILAFAPAIFIAAGVAFLTLTAKGKKTSQKLKAAFSDVAKTAKSVISDAIKPMTDAIQAQIPKLDKWIKTLKGPLKDAFASSSKFLDDFRTGFQNFISNTLKGLAEALKNPAMKPAIEGFKKLMGDIGTAIGSFFVTLAKGGVDYGKTLGALGDALIKMAPALADMLNAFAKVSPDVINRLASSLVAIFKMFSDPKTVQALSFLAAVSFDTIVKSLIFVAETLHFSVVAWEKLKAAAKETIDFFKKAWPEAVQFVKDLWNGLTQAASDTWDAIKSVFSDIGSFLSTVFDPVGAAFAAPWNFLVTVVKSTWDVIHAIIFGNIDQVNQAISKGVSDILSAWTDGWNAANRLVADVWNIIATVVKAGVDAITSVITAGVKAIPGIVSGGFHLVTDFISTSMNLGSSLVSAGWNAIKSLFTGGAKSTGSIMSTVPRLILNALGNVNSLLLEAGRAILRGLISGVKSMFNSLKDQFYGVVDFVRGVVNTISDFVDRIIGLAKSAVGWLSKLPFGGDATISLEDNTNGAGRRPFNPGFPPAEPMPMGGGLFDFQSSFNSMQASARRLNSSVFKSASNSKGTSAGVAGLAPRVYQFGDIIADDKPTPEAIIKALGYADALYA